jgi:hypothetical protein
MSWKTCGRCYEVGEFEVGGEPWRELRRIGASDHVRAPFFIPPKHTPLLILSLILILLLIWNRELEQD